MRRTRNLALAVLPFLAGACSGPVVLVAPSVQVSRLDSHLITPEGIRFQAKVVIKNEMRGRLDIDRVEWGADLHDNPVVEDTFDRLHTMRAHRQQTVTVPFEVAMSSILDQAVDVLAEEGVRVRFRGSVYPEGFDPIPFEATRTLPLPKIPAVSIEGVTGKPFGGSFTVFLGIRNTNGFPLTVTNVDSHLNLNGKKYDLLKTEGAARIAPGARGKIALTMRQTAGKSLSMALNVVRSRSTDFEIGGLIRCGTPHGVIEVPLALRSK